MNIEVTIPMIYKAVNANCSLRPDALSSYSANRNFEYSMMPKALAAKVMMENGLSGKSAKQEVASSDKDWDEIVKVINRRDDPEMEQRWVTKLKLIRTHLALRLEKEVELASKHKL